MAAKNPARYVLGQKVRTSVSRIDRANKIITRSVEEVTIDHVHDFFSLSPRKAAAYVYGGKTADGVEAGPFTESMVVE